MPITLQPTQQSSQPTQFVAILRHMGGLVFDAVFNESHESELEVTDNPVESGVVVSDHAFMKPLRLTIQAGVSDAMLVEKINDQFSSESGRSRRAFELLTELQRKAEPFDVQTGLKLYTSMVCTSVRTEQDKDTDQALFFTAELREVIIVYTQIVTYPPRKKGATANQAGAKKDKGEQQGEQQTKTEKKSSILQKAAKAAKGE